MGKNKKTELIKQLVWDYSIPAKELEEVIEGRKTYAGHYTRSILFRKIIETYPWYTVLQLFTPQEIRSLLTIDLIRSLRVNALRKQYEFIYHRLQEGIPVAG